LQSYIQCNNLISCNFAHLAQISQHGWASRPGSGGVFSLNPEKKSIFLIMVEKGGLAMNLLRKCSCLLLLAFLTAYGGVALAALTPSLPSKSDNVSVVQAQPDTPVDCKKTPNDPRCKPIGRAGFAFFSSPDAAGGPLREPAPNLAMSDK
jgi:hypothetical protein